MWFLGKGVIKDLRARSKLWVQDWRDGLKLKTVSATLFIFFSSILPAVTFGVYLQSHTEQSIGITEVVVSTGLCGVVFAIFGGQPLVIIGVTGPISIFIVTVYDICQRLGIPFEGFMGWIGIWAAILHFVVALTNLCELVRIVTRFSCEIFGLLIGVIFIESASREIITLWDHSPIDAAILSLFLAFLTFYCCSVFHHARRWKILLPWMRGLIADYGAVASIVVFSAVPLLPIWSFVPIDHIPVPSQGFTTTNGREWWIGPALHSLPVGYCFAALIPALILTILVYFDHNVSSLLSQQKEFNLKKPPAFNWDFVIVGFLMLGCALLGLPWGHGLIPQSPLHVRALAVIKEKKVVHGTTTSSKEVFEAIHETRLANLLQSGLILGGAAIIYVFGLVPTGVIAGFFFYLGYSAFLENQFAERIKLLFTDYRRRAPTFSLRDVPMKIVFFFTLIQFILCGVIFGITLTPAAISFPIFILILIPLRRFLLPKFFRKDHLKKLDSESSDSAEDPADVELSAPSQQNIASYPGVQVDT